MSQTAISRIWRAFGLKPHLDAAWKLSTAEPVNLGETGHAGNC